MSKHTPGYPNKIALPTKTPMTDIKRQARNKAKSLRKGVVGSVANAHRAIRRHNKAVRQGNA